MHEAKRHSPGLMLAAILIGSAGCLAGARIGGQDYVVVGGGAALLVSAVIYYTFRGIRGRKAQESPKVTAADMLKLFPKDELLDVLIVATYCIGLKKMSEEDAFLTACCAVNFHKRGTGEDKENGYTLLGNSILWGQQNKTISVPIIDRLNKSLESRYGVSLK